MDFTWAEVNLAIAFLKPFAFAVTALEADRKYSSCSAVVPVLLTVQDHLADNIKEGGKFHVWQKEARLLLQGMDRRFGHIFYVENEKFDVTFLACPMLDPERSNELEPTLFEEGKKRLALFILSEGYPLFELPSQTTDSVVISLEPEPTSSQSTSQPSNQQQSSVNEAVSTNSCTQDIDEDDAPIVVKKRRLIPASSTEQQPGHRLDNQYKEALKQEVQRYLDRISRVSLAS